MKRTAVVATTALAVALAGSTPALADTTPSLDRAKALVTARIDKRLTALGQFTDTLNQAKQVQPAHRATLTTLIAEQTGGLTRLRAKVEQETNRAALKDDAKSMVTDYRVFILTGPKVRLTAAIDTELAVAAKIGDKADGTASSLTGKVDALLAISPGPDGDAIRAQVKPIREAARQARTDLKQLRRTK